MKNKQGIPMMILGGCMVFLGIMLIAFPPPGEGSTGSFFLIWMGLVFFFSGLYMSTRTPKQFRKEFPDSVQDERDEKLNGKAAGLGLFVMELLCVAAAVFVLYVAPENQLALYLILGLALAGALVFAIARAVCARKM